MRALRLLNATFITVAVALSVAVARHVYIDLPALITGARGNPPGPWVDLEEWGRSWLAGLAVGLLFGLMYYFWPKETDPAQQTDSPHNRPGN